MRGGGCHGVIAGRLTGVRNTKSCLFSNNQWGSITMRTSAGFPEKSQYWTEKSKFQIHEAGGVEFREGEIAVSVATREGSGSEMQRKQGWAEQVRQTGFRVKAEGPSRCSRKARAGEGPLEKANAVLGAPGGRRPRTRHHGCGGRSLHTQTLQGSLALGSRGRVEP